VPALTAAGYRVILASHRGMPPSPVPPGPYRIADLVADVEALITELGAGPCHLVGASLGAFVAQELALVRPDLVRSAVLIGTRARSDHYRRSLARATAARARAGGPVTDLETLCRLPQLFGPETLADERNVMDWIEMARRFPVTGAGPAAQYEASVITDRREALRQVNRPCLVIAFGADIIAPPMSGREVHEAIPGCSYVEFADLGHFGFLEESKAVNEAIIAFLARH